MIDRYPVDRISFVVFTYAVGAARRGQASTVIGEMVVVDDDRRSRLDYKGQVGVIGYGRRRVFRSRRG